MHIWVIEVFVDGEYGPERCPAIRLTREKAREDKRWLDEFLSQEGPYRIRKYVREEV